MTRRLMVSIAVALWALILPAQVTAHAMQMSTQPADGATLEGAPERIGMTFDAPMRITNFVLKDANGQRHEVQRKDGMQPVTQLEAKPSALAPGQYTVQWRGVAADGHAMSGSFSFSVR